MKKSIPAYRRHDISDETLVLLEPNLPGRKGAWAAWAKTIAFLSMRFSGYCAQASRLIEGIDAAHLLADNAYDTGVILAQAASQGMDAVIPPKKIRKDQRRYDAELYRQKTPNPSSPPSKSAALSAVLMSRDYAI